MKNLFMLAIVALVLFSCGPQAAYFQVEAKDMQGQTVSMDNKQIAVLSVASSAKTDSTRSANAALGLAEKLRQDRGWENPLPVFSVSTKEFAGFSSPMGLDKEFLKSLMFTTGADLQIFVENLRFGRYTIESAVNYEANYSTNIVSLPYTVDMHIYDVLEDSLLYVAAVKDTVYMQMISDNGKKDYNGFISGKLAEVSSVVGESLASRLTHQWEKQERLLVNYPEDEAWEKPLALAMKFRWDEAVALWMPMTSSPNARIAAYAAYNIAVGCEMMERFALAREWADFSVKKYRFRENAELKEYLKRKK